MKAIGAREFEGELWVKAADHTAQICEVMGEAQCLREERKQMAEQIDRLKDQIRDLCLRDTP